MTSSERRKNAYTEKEKEEIRLREKKRLAGISKKYTLTEAKKLFRNKSLR